MSKIILLTEGMDTIVNLAYLIKEQIKEIDALVSKWNSVEESEDERIRQALLEYFGEECDTATINGIYCYKIYNWLEKQGKTSPVLSNSLNIGKMENKGNEEKISPKWSKEDEEEFKIAIETLHEAGQHSSAMWLKSIKQRIAQ